MYPYKRCKICGDWGHYSNACPKNVEDNLCKMIEENIDCDWDKHSQEQSNEAQSFDNDNKFKSE